MKIKCLVEVAVEKIVGAMLERERNKNFLMKIILFPSPHKTEQKTHNFNQIGHRQKHLLNINSIVNHSNASSTKLESDFVVKEWKYNDDKNQEFAKTNLII